MPQSNAGNNRAVRAVGAHRRHLDVPDDLSVVGFDDTNAAVITLWPPLTTIRQPDHRLAAEALQRLIGAIQETDGASVEALGQIHVLPHELIKRHSTTRPK